MSTDDTKTHTLNVYHDETDWYVAANLDDLRAKWEAYCDHDEPFNAANWAIVADDMLIEIHVEDERDVPEALRSSAHSEGGNSGACLVGATAREWADNYGEGTGFLCSTEW